MRAFDAADELGGVVGVECRGDGGDDVAQDEVGAGGREVEEVWLGGLVGLGWFGAGRAHCGGGSSFPPCR